MAWCPCDSSFLLTCSKDNRTLCWDTGSGEVCDELLRIHTHLRVQTLKWPILILFLSCMHEICTVIPESYLYLNLQNSHVRDLHESLKVLNV